ncbi:MAG: ABC transporter substrate-binding protein [Clostridiales bacterium GWF2_38_85]|nr:MAG: ABC transporter substrate-binding protein [Clostridiales bacterium GWF2_38_85]HBL84528.1 ABC transporter substrate-binding protein [Clostridiales bacterium]
MKKNLSIILSILAVLMLFAGCNINNNTESGSDKIIVAVSIVPEQTFVEAVCGNLVDIVTIVPPGSSPETYEPSPKEMLEFNQAEIYFSVGVEIEEASIMPNVGDKKVVALADEVAKVYDNISFESGGRDPHIWLSPKRVKVMINVIAEEMGKLDPDNKTKYAENAQAYIEKLNELDLEIKNALDGVQNRKFIVFHPAFGYLAADYGLTMYSLEEEGKEATAQHLQEMIDLAKAENIKVIFYQEEIDSNQSKAFAEELGGKTIQLAPLAANYIENLEAMASTIAEAME